MPFKAFPALFIASRLKRLATHPYSKPTDEVQKSKHNPTTTQSTQPTKIYFALFHIISFVLGLNSSRFDTDWMRDLQLIWAYRTYY
jgi:hypothetical protein